MENKFDEKISKMLNEEVYIPQKITNRIRISLKAEKKGVWLNMKLKKIVVTLACVVVIGTGAVFATKTIIEYRKSMNIASEYGYFEEGQKEYIFFNGLGIRVDNYFMDKNQLGITFNFEIEENMQLVDFYSIGLQGTEIHFFDENREEIIMEDTGDNMGFEEITNIDNRHTTAIYTMKKAKEFKSQKIIVKIDKVLFAQDGETQLKEYKGNWEFELSTEKYLNNQNDIQYKGITNAENIIVQKAELTATNFNIVLEIDNLDELVKPYVSLFEVGKLIGTDVEIGIKNMRSSIGYDYDNNTATINMELSKFEAHDEYQLILITNEGSNPEIIITLTRK